MLLLNVIVLGGFLQALSFVLAERVDPSQIATVNHTVASLKTVVHDMSKKQEKGDLRLNYSKERGAALKRTESVLETMLGKDEGGENTKKKDQSLLLKMAYVRESMGLVFLYPPSHHLSSFLLPLSRWWVLEGCSASS